MRIECSICFYDIEQEDFSPLPCCPMQKICITCVRSLVCMRCPFCRRAFMGEDNSIQTTTETTLFVPPSDPYYRSTPFPRSANVMTAEVMPASLVHPDSSRIQRKRNRRFQKLEMRIQDREYNRTLSNLKKQSKMLQRQITEEISLWNHEQRGLPIVPCTHNTVLVPSPTTVAH